MVAHGAFFMYGKQHASPPRARCRSFVDDHRPSPRLNHTGEEKMQKQTTYRVQRDGRARRLAVAGPAVPNLMVLAVGETRADLGRELRVRRQTHEQHDEQSAGVLGCYSHGE